MPLNQCDDRVLECPRFELILEGDGKHDPVMIMVGFEFCHRFLYLIEPGSFALDSPTFSTVSTARITGRWVGVDSAWEQENPMPQKSQFDSENPVVRVDALLG
jgi:hypothetical protein